MMSRLQLPRRTCSSFAASISICQLARNRVCEFNSRNDRCMNAHKSCRNRSAYMLAGEGAILFPRFLCAAVLHSLIGRPQDFDVRGAERKLARFNGDTGFDFVNPVEEPTHRSLIAARSLCRKLHRRRLDLRNLPSSPTHCRGDVVSSGLHYVRAQVFAAFRSALWIAASALAKLRVFGWLTAADFSCSAHYVFSSFGHCI